MQKPIRQWYWVLLILGVAAVAAFLLSKARQAPDKKTEERLPPLVSLQAVQSSALRYQISSQGTAQAKTETVLVSEVNGKIVAIADVFSAGGFFRQGDLLVSIEQADYRTAVKAAEATLASAKAALEEEKARAKVAERDWREFTSGKAPALGLRKPQLASALAKVQSSEAELEKALRDLSRTEIRAPYSGMVKSRAANLGQFVSRGTQLGVLLDTTVAEIRLPLSQADFADLAASRPEDFPVPVTLSQGQQQWQASLVRTEGILDEKSRVIYAVAELADPYGRETAATGQPLRSAQPLRFGQFVQASISGRQASGVIQLPRHLLRPGNQLLVADSNLTLQFRQVRLDRADQQFAYVGEGLQNGDQLVISPLANPLPGMKVRLDSPAAPESPVTDAADTAAKDAGATAQ